MESNSFDYIVRSDRFERSNEVTALTYDDLTRRSNKELHAIMLREHRQLRHLITIYDEIRMPSHLRNELSSVVDSINTSGIDENESEETREEILRVILRIGQIAEGQRKAIIQYQKSMEVAISGAIVISKSVKRSLGIE